MERLEVDKSHVQSFRRAAAVANLVVLAIALGVFVGWEFDISWLRGWAFGRPDTPPNTALVLVLLSLAALGLEARAKAVRALAWLCALAAGVIGVLMFIEYAFQLDYGFDALLVRTGPSFPVPGRNAPQAGVAFALAAPALLLGTGPGARVRLADALAGMIGLIAIFDLCAHAYGAETLFLVAGRAQSGMGIPTATSLVLLSISQLLMRADRGLTAELACKGPGGYFLRRFVPVAIVAPILIGLGVPLLQRIGIHETSAALALIAAATIPAGLAVLYFSGHALNRAEAERIQTLATKSMLAAIVESSTDAIYTRDLEGRITSWNAGATRMFGYSAEEVLGRSMHDMVPAERHWEIEAAIGAIGRRELYLPLETVRLRKDGKPIPVLQTISAMRDDQGRLFGYSVVAHDITDRKRSENELRKSEERLRQVIEQASDGIFLADAQGRYTAANPAGAALLGYAPDELIGRRIAEFLPAGEESRLARDYEMNLRGEPTRGEWTLRHRDGHWVPVEVTSKVLSDGRWQGFVRDITDRKRAERALAESHARERRWRAQLESVGRAAHEVSAAVAAHPGSELTSVMKTLVVQARAVTGARFAALGIGDDHNHCAEPWVFSGTPETEARRAGRVDGSLTGVATDAEARRLEDLEQLARFRKGRPGESTSDGFLAVPLRFGGRDIGALYLSDKEGGFTEEDKFAAELLASRVSAALVTAGILRRESLARAWLKSVIDQMPEGVLLADEHGRLTWNNAALALGVEDGLLDSRGNEIRLQARTPAGRPVEWDALPIFTALERQEEISGVELVLRSGSGRDVWVIVNASPVPGGGAVAVFQDISALKELQRLRDEWTAIVAHDLRQPVGAIRLAAEIARRAHRGEMTPSEENALVRIGDGSRRLSRMIEDLLEASRIESRQVRLDRQCVDIEVLTRELVEQSEFVPEDRPVKVLTVGQVPCVAADPMRLQQVLTNLLSNAVRYGRPGTEIRVILRTLTGEVEVAVENEGPGMTPEELEHVFDRRFRGKHAEELAAGGLGMGLYIVKGLIEAHGGEICAESEPDGITTFRFTLPVWTGVQTGAHAHVWQAD